MSADSHHDLSPEEVEWTARICRHASALGVKVREESLGGSFRFNWLLPASGVLHVKAAPSRQLALMRACVDLCRHLGSPLAATCPRFFL